MCAPGTAQTLRHETEGPGSQPISRRGFLAAGAGAAAVALLPGRPAWGGPGRGLRRFEDLTHPFSETFPVYAGPQADREVFLTIAETGFYSQTWSFAEHTATHVDAPGHVVEGGRLAPELTPDELVRPLVVVDISGRAGPDRPNATVEVSDLVAFERRHGRILTGSLVCMYSGWERWLSSGDPAGNYRGTNFGEGLNFPGFGREGAEWLLERRDVAGIGVDTLSLDPGSSTDFPVHQLLLGADRYGVENLANLARIPPRGATGYVGLVPWEEGSGGPCRVVAGW